MKKEQTEAHDAQAQLSELRKAHAQLLALERNINGMAIQYRDLNAQHEFKLKEFEAAKTKLEQASGLTYNQDSLELVKPEA